VLLQVVDALLRAAVRAAAPWLRVARPLGSASLAIEAGGAGAPRPPSTGAARPTAGAARPTGDAARPARKTEVTLSL